MELTMKILFVIYTTFIACSCAANETGLATLTEYDCGCPGQNASYTCTAVGGVITVWGGTAFNCAGGNEIPLRHNQFEGAIGECNDGAIIGYSIENIDNCYTSRLDVRLSADLHGLTVTCSVDDGSSVTTLGTTTLMVSTQSAPPPSPSRISTLLLNNGRELVFGWNQVDYNCPTLQYAFTSQNCGSCAQVTPTAASCTEFQTSSVGIPCIFTVQSTVCGNVTGVMQSTNVNLKVPDAPTVQSLPRYLDGRNKILLGLMTTFSVVEPSLISGGIDGSITNYTITYSDSTFGSSCGTVNIPASSCVGETCTHNFDIFKSSSCPPSTAVTVSVVAANVLGSGHSSPPLVREGLNNLVNVNFDPNQRTITCTFLNQPLNTMKQCSANITYGANCDILLNVYSNIGIGDTVVTPQLETVPGVVEYCFLVTAISNNVTVLVEGNLQNLDSQANVTAAVVVPLLLVLLVLIILVVLVVVAAVYNIKSKSNVRICFSVEDKPGSLAKALKVFKDCHVNILGLNTHLHHADFNRNAGRGYKFNTIYCMCKKEDKEFLKNELKAEFEGDDQEHESSSVGNKPVTVAAIIKVKNRPGALWKAIHTIGDHNINISGVNTLSDRQSSPGYKYNYVKCCCSQRSLRKVHTELKMATGKEVNIKFLDEEHKEEQAIEYLVRDEVGALANTLQIFSTLGINISGINPDHLPAHINRTTKQGLKINFIECSIDRSMKEKLSHRLKSDYGAVNVEVEDKPLDNDPNYKLVKVTILNETGSLNRALKAFHDLNINLHGVNILSPAFERAKEIAYKHYHLEITVTRDQEIELEKTLQAQGLAIDVKPFDLSKHQQSDHDDVQNFLQTQCESEESDSKAVTDVSPNTKVIQFLVRDEVGALANALQIFSELGINITMVNPAHLSREHQDEFVECSCAKDKRESLTDKIMSYGAIKAELLPESEVQQSKICSDPNTCVVKFSVESENVSIDKVLKAFSDMGVKVFKVNPPRIKVHNQYVECCCTEKEETYLLTKLKAVHGVTNVTLVPESKVSTKPVQDPNYRIIKFSVGDKAETLVRALTVFFDLNINIIGVNTLNLRFNRMHKIKYKHNHVVFLATDDQKEELKHNLLVTGLATDVKPYKHVQRSDDEKPLQAGNMDIALTSVRVTKD